MSQKTSCSSTDLASVARVLEGLLPHGYQLSHTRHRYWIKRWDSYWHNDRQPRMGWCDVDSDTDLAVLLERLGEH